MNAHFLGSYPSILDLSAFSSPPGSWLMAAIKGYFDDSGDDKDPQHQACAFGGYTASAGQWPSFEAAWNEVLRDFDVPYLHMKEFGRPNGPYAKWEDKAKEHEKIVFFQRLCQVIAAHGPLGFGATVRIRDLKKFNDHHPRAKIDLRAFCIFATVLDFLLKHPDQEAELVFDHFEKAHSKIELAREYLRTDPYYTQFREAVERISMLPLAKESRARNVPPMQAADFVAWEMRKSSENKNGWFNEIKPDVDPKHWFYSLLKWRAQNAPGKTIQFPAGLERGSYWHLLRAAKFEGVVWDYRALETANAPRKGVWPQP